MKKRWSMIEKDDFYLIINEGGTTLGISKANKNAIVEVDGYAFKDLNRNGILDLYEDWRLPVDERLDDLVKRLSIAEIAGLMLYSSHQMLTIRPEMANFFGNEETREHAWDLAEAQKAFLKDDNLRHVLIAMIDDAYTAAKWNNNAQAFVEGIAYGIPVNTSSDPRHSIAASGEFDMGAGSRISKWPQHIGLAATFDPALVEEFGEIASKEYRAMGITTALSPQIDLASDPRWNRFKGTFGAGSKLVTEMSRAYCDGFQKSEYDSEIKDGWGYDSVNAMVKHWPGGGSGEGGRDAHSGFGKYAVYPGNNFDEHLLPFTEGAFKLKSKTSKASAVMPYYTISYNMDKSGENVGNAFSKYIIEDKLRNEYDYDGVVCTDWNITHDMQDFESPITGKPWGVEEMSVTDRHYKVLMAGVDQFGGNDDAAPVIAAYEKGVIEHGEAFMRKRMELSAKRLLRNIMRVGLFENPYLDVDLSNELVGSTEYMDIGYKAQLKSVVMLKNANGLLPIKNKQKVFIPMRRTEEGQNWFGSPIPAIDEIPVDLDVIKQYFDIAENPDEADCAFAFIVTPETKGYTQDTGYQPISLQYRPYTVRNARKTSIATPDDNRSYAGKTVKCRFEPHLDMILELRKAMGNKPVIVFVETANPFVPAEFEATADAILLDFCVLPEVLMDIVTGKTEPSGLLPFTIPKNMETVEKHSEDVSFDMEPYKDSAGNHYDFAFGLNWNGVIKDSRTDRYR